MDKKPEKSFWWPSWNSPLPATFFHHENDFSGFFGPENLDKTPNSSLQDRCRWSYIGRKGAAAILDAWVPYNDQESKLGDI